MVRAACLMPLLALLVGCPSSPCDPGRTVDLEVGGGDERSGFLPLQDGADVAMWSVRHDLSDACGQALQADLAVVLR